jgi:hypothetical protein
VNPELSQRLARAVNLARLPAGEKDAVAAAAEGVDTFEELPEWVRDLVLDAETRHAEQDIAAEEEQA